MSAGNKPYQTSNSKSPYLSRNNVPSTKNTNMDNRSLPKQGKDSRNRVGSTVVKGAPLDWRAELTRFGDLGTTSEGSSGNDGVDVMEQVGKAMQEFSSLQQLQNMKAQPPVSTSNPNSYTKPNSKEEQTTSKVSEQLPSKEADMTKSIMRKLYHKNVQLEKENQLLRVQLGLPAERPQGASNEDGAAETDGQDTQLDLSGSKQQPPARPQSALLGATSSPTLALLEERDRTIAHMQSQMAAVQRRCDALEQMLMQRQHGLVEKAGMDEAVEMSQVVMDQYRRIRQDYRQLLNRRAQHVLHTASANKNAKKVVVELHQRLEQEIQERETEAAIYNAKLYQTEQKESDWYVERKLLQHRVEQLQAEVQERDRLDSQIETCVVSMFERVRELEEKNADLSTKLGLPPSGSNNSNADILTVTQ